jgi:uncharacterized protein with gpF-like domain
VQTWNTAGDERVRESHADMEGQQVPLGQPFVSGLGNDLMYPGDPSAPAEDVINCRCVVTRELSHASDSSSSGSASADSSVDHGELEAA